VRPRRQRLLYGRRGLDLALFEQGEDSTPANRVTFILEWAGENDIEAEPVGAVLSSAPTSVPATATSTATGAWIPLEPPPRFDANQQLIEPPPDLRTLVATTLANNKMGFVGGKHVDPHGNQLNRAEVENNVLIDCVQAYKA
jgi:hypothetical protein